MRTRFAVVRPGLHRDVMPQGDGQCLDKFVGSHSGSGVAYFCRLVAHIHGAFKSRRCGRQAQGSADAGPDNLMQTYSQLQQET